MTFSQSRTFSQSSVVVRFAQLEDGDRIAQLCHQLGYTVSTEQVQQRIAQLLQDDDCNVVYIAETATEGVIGWIHLYICQLLTDERSAVIGGLVVNAQFRHQGVGKLLLQASEQWASEHNCQEILVRSNVRRLAAHQFYERRGFEEIKRSVVFRKASAALRTED